MKRPECSPGFCALVCIMAWIDLQLCGWFLISVLVHEAGHLAATKLLHVPVVSIQFRLNGAVIQTGITGYWEEALISAAGPAASISLSILTLRLCTELSVIAALHAAVNLLPLFPLDGGRLMRILLLQIVPQNQSERILKVLSALTACLLMVLSCWLTIWLQAGIWPIFAAMVLLWRASDP